MPTLRRFILRPDMLLFLASVLLFGTWHEIDLAVAGWFYEVGNGFPLGDTVLVHILYEAFQGVGWIVLIGAVVGWMLGRWAGGRGLATRRACAFLLLAGLLGPLLLVNGVFKEHWGRARPHDVVQFGGDRAYTPALVPARECDSNCSFVSGHASAGFYFLSFAWVYRHRRWFLVGVGLGFVAGAIRIVEGDHFLGDVVFSGWVTYASCLVAARIIYGDIRVTLNRPGISETPFLRRMEQ